MPQRPTGKPDVVNALLTPTSSVFIHLDPRREGVVVPPQFRKSPALVLEIGLNMRVPIPDLDVGNDGIGCTLSFGGRPFWCWLPWHSIFAVVTGEKRGMLWQSDVPPEVEDRYVRSDESTKPKPPPPRLVAVKDTKEEAELSGEPQEPIAPVRPLRPLKTPMPDSDGNAAGVLEPADTEQPSDSDTQEDNPPAPGGGKPKRKLPPYLRLVQ